MSDANGLKMLKDHFGYTAGDILIRRFESLMLEMGLDPYPDKGADSQGDSIQGLLNVASATDGGQQDVERARAGRESVAHDFLFPRRNCVWR
jgi:hypothetical protein